jgi:hypothetical protein
MLSVVMGSDPMMRLRKSRFRMQFMLSEFEKRQVREQGLAELQDNAREIVIKKLSNPIIDGKQTPFYGSPVFKAMHATACCCRKCLFKWHRILPNRQLSEKDIDYIQDLIYRWIKKQLFQ